MISNTPHALSIYLDGANSGLDANVDSIDYGTFKKLILFLNKQ